MAIAEESGGVDEGNQAAFFFFCFFFCFLRIWKDALQGYPSLVHEQTIPLK